MGVLDLDYYYRTSGNYNSYHNYYRPNGNQRAVAYLKGGPLRPEIRGLVHFEDALGGTWVRVQVSGLPDYRPGSEGQNPIGPHGFHIHEYGSCDIGDRDQPFMSAGGHFNPYMQPHGNHAGDFPVLFSNNGRASMTFFTDKFKVNDIIGKAVIIHESPDDYRTQPAGDAGKRLACGIIERVGPAYS